MGVRSLPSLLNDADVLKDNVHSFTDKNVHVDLMGPYFALIRALYCKLFQQEAAKITRQSPLDIVFATASANVHAAFTSVGRGARRAANRQHEANQHDTIGSETMPQLAQSGSGQASTRPVNILSTDNKDKRPLPSVLGFQNEGITDNTIRQAPGERTSRAPGID